MIGRWTNASQTATAVAEISAAASPANRTFFSASDALVPQYLALRGATLHA
jgi:hypothetical protein